MPGGRNKTGLLHIPVILAGYDPCLVKLRFGLAGKANFAGWLYLLQCLVLSLCLTALVALNCRIFLLLLPCFAIVFTGLIRLRYRINVLRQKAHFKPELPVLYMLLFILFILSWLSLSISLLSPYLQLLPLQHAGNKTPSYTFCFQLLKALIQLPQSNAGGLNHTNMYLPWILSAVLLVFLLVVMALPEMVKRTGIHNKHQYLKLTHDKIIPYLR